MNPLITCLTPGEITRKNDFRLLSRVLSGGVLILFCTAGTGFAQNRIWFSELGMNLVPSQKSSWQGGSHTARNSTGFHASLNRGGKKFAVGLQLNYAKTKPGEAGYPGVYRQSVSLWEYFVLLRYYSMIPDLRVGTQLAFRFTGGLMLGGYNFYWRDDTEYGHPLQWTPTQFIPSVFAGLVISPFYNTTGVVLKFHYHPQPLKAENFPLKGFELNRPVSVSASIFLGSRIR